MAKQIGLTQQVDEGEFKGIQFVKPSEKTKTMVARSADYTVIMHFNEAMKARLLSNAD